MDSIKKWTRLTVKESIKTAENRDKWRKYVHGVNQPSDRGRLKKRTEYFIRNFLTLANPVHGGTNKRRQFDNIDS